MLPVQQAENAPIGADDVAARNVSVEDQRTWSGEEDALGPARGVFLGALIGLVLWGVILGFVWLLVLR